MDSTKIDNSISYKNEDQAYEEIMLEIEEDRKIKSIWAKAFAQSDGDENKAKAMYIKLRIESMNIEETQLDEKELNVSVSNVSNDKLLIIITILILVGTLPILVSSFNAYTAYYEYAINN